MNLRDLADISLLVSWASATTSSPCQHQVERSIEMEFWKYVGFLQHSWKKGIDRNQIRSVQGIDPHLHEEILVAGLLISTVGRRLEVGEGAAAGASLRWEQQQQDLVKGCRRLLTTVPELLKLQRLERRLQPWKMRLMERLPRSPGMASVGHADRPLDVIRGESLIWPLERAALRWLIPRRVVHDSMRGAACLHLATLSLSLIPESAHAGDGLLRSRLLRKIEGEAWSDGGRRLARVAKQINTF